MRVQVFHLFFKNDGNGGFLPVDPELYELAVNYAAEKLADPVSFEQYKDTWVACEVDPQGQPLQVLGLICMVLRADFPVCRFSHNAAAIKLFERVQGHLHDVYGARGAEAFVIVDPNEPPDNRCPNRDEWIRTFDMYPANRYAVKIR